MPPAGGLPWRLCSKTMGENPYSADFAAKVLFGVLDRVGVDKVIVVAHSLGAQVALRAARSRPGMVRAMVLVAPAVLNPLDSKFVMGRDPNANLFSAILNLRTRVEMTAKLAAFNLQLLQPGEGPLHAVRNMTLNGDVEERVQQNFHDRSITLGRPELVAKYIEPLRDPLWDRGLVHFYKSLQVCLACAFVFRACVVPYMVYSVRVLLYSASPALYSERTDPNEKTFTHRVCRQSAGVCVDYAGEGGVCGERRICCTRRAEGQGVSIVSKRDTKISIGGYSLGPGLCSRLTNAHFDERPRICL
ncbi:unnamed protein product [Ectocarpus sp. 4 AP-2014]